MSGPLSGIRVLDFTWALAGPYGTMILADLGADVIKVEVPDGGDRARMQGPLVEEVSTYFFSVNRGKRSIVLDLKTVKGKDIAIRLAETVDVVVENFTPGTMDRLGLGYEELRRHNPRLIYAALSGFGKDGPYAGRPCLDSIVQAMGGLMSVTGVEGGPPIRCGASIGDIAGGMFLAIGITAALAERALHQGQGQMLDLGMLDCQATILENAFVRYFATGDEPKKCGSRHPVSAVHQVFPTKDGHIAVVASGGLEMWTRFLEIIDRLDLVGEEKYHSKISRAEHIDELEPIIVEALAKKTTREWIEAFDAAGIACGPLNTISQAANDPQLNHRGMFLDLPCPQTTSGQMKVANTPFRYSATPTAPDKGAPGLGEHTAEVLSSVLNLGQEEIADLERTGVTGIRRDGTTT